MCTFPFVNNIPITVHNKIVYFKDCIEERYSLFLFEQESSDQEEFCVYVVRVGEF